MQGRKACDTPIPRSSSIIPFALTGPCPSCRKCRATAATISSACPLQTSNTSRIRSRQPCTITSLKQCREEGTRVRRVCYGRRQADRPEHITSSIKQSNETHLLSCPWATRLHSASMRARRSGCVRTYRTHGVWFRSIASQSTEETPPPLHPLSFPFRTLVMAYPMASYPSTSASPSCVGSKRCWLLRTA